MSLSQDLECILNVVDRADPGFAGVGRARIDSAVGDLRKEVAQNDTDAFLLAAMRLLALAGNGHTRLIPNKAISVLPFRFVCVGAGVFLTSTDPVQAGEQASRLVAVNGTPVSEIERAAAGYLAGTPQRKRVIGPILLAWPAALARLGVAGQAHQTTYRFENAEGQLSEVTAPHAKTVPASTLYPVAEHGRADPVPALGGFAQISEISAECLAIALPGFLETKTNALAEAISAAAAGVRAQPDRFLVIDVRGNTGGDFLKTMPLIDAIAERTRERVCAVLVDKFTFSAAIVFVALLKYRLGDRMVLVGEEMGDGLRFFAEGGTVDLPASGAAVRYASAFHDWENGSTDETTPPEIARCVVPVRRLDIDRHWVATPFDATPRDLAWRRLADALA
ncbi:peptidase S41 [uncultured Roseobacter sp.]|uniref:peptidase S41 n=1 Tax=uncultured Roseobacter sp. TaxID=114847 RepID=UPI002629444D|nr:peptidase S41 [uncultured Roseobacter sp.]